MEKRIHADNLTLQITKGPFPVDEALEDYLHIGERMEDVHKKGIIHYGIKPTKKTFLFLWLIILSSILTSAQGKKLREPDVRYEPSPQNVVERMLKLANVHKGDVVYDLGCGDGRIVITAAKQFGATGVGIDINPIRIKESLQNARKAGVIDRVTFSIGDLFTADIQEATVVALFLSRSVNLKLRPKLLRELKPGTRVVSYYWDMDDWKPDKRIEVDGDPIYLWTIPSKKVFYFN
jgi:SAM-dependent methyltransferase